MIFIETGSTDANFNFALECYLLENKLADEEIFLFWRTTPTLMLGRNQLARAELNLATARELGVRICRRVSGGGAIFTDMGAWQYTFLTHARRVDFKPYTERVAAALRLLGVPALAGGRNDITAEGKKISGAAQYLSQGRAICHGSLLYSCDLDLMEKLLSPSDDKLTTKGLRSVRQRVRNLSDYLPGDPEKFRALLLALLLDGGASEYALSESDIAAVREIKERKFDTSAWIEDSAPPFDIIKRTRTTAGGVEFHLSVADGRITACRIFGDFFSSGEISAAEQALTGVRYRRDEVLKALESLDGLFYEITPEALAECIAGE